MNNVSGSGIKNRYVNSGKKYKAGIKNVNSVKSMLNNSAPVVKKPVNLNIQSKGISENHNLLNNAEKTHTNSNSHIVTNNFSKLHMKNTNILDKSSPMFKKVRSGSSKNLHVVLNPTYSYKENIYEKEFFSFTNKHEQLKFGSGLPMNANTINNNNNNNNSVSCSQPNSTLHHIGFPARSSSEPKLNIGGNLGFINS